MNHNIGRNPSKRDYGPEPCQVEECIQPEPVKPNETKIIINPLAKTRDVVKLFRIQFSIVISEFPFRTFAL